MNSQLYILYYCSHMFEKFIRVVRPECTWSHEEASIQILQKIVDEQKDVFRKYGLDEQDITFIKVGPTFTFTIIITDIIFRRSSTDPWTVPQCPLTSPGRTRGVTSPRPSSLRSSPTRVAPLTSTRFAFRTKIFTCSNLIYLSSLIICFVMEPG